MTTLTITRDDGTTTRSGICDFDSVAIETGYRLTCRTCGRVVNQRKPNRIAACSLKQNFPEPRKPWWRFLPRPGNVAAWLIYRLTGITLEQGGCQCKQRRATMNAKGWLWCAKNLRTIYGWMREGWAGRKK
jgi:hypothetical protein